jgi:hypothetical protein
MSYDTETERYVAIDGQQRDSFVAAKELDAEEIRWYGQHFENATHLSNCHSCSSVQAMYEDAYTDNRITEGLRMLNRTPEEMWETLRGQLATTERQLADMTLDRDNKKYLHEKAAETVTQLRETVTQLQDAAELPITDPADRRLWGIFGKAAKEANRRGYCGHYDQISEAVGIPTRDELQEAGYLEPGRYDVTTKVTFEVTITVEAEDEYDAVSTVDAMSDAHLWELIDTAELDQDRMIDHDAWTAEAVKDDWSVSD